MQETAVFSHVPLTHFSSVRFLKSHFSKQDLIVDLEIKLYSNLSALKLASPDILIDLIESVLGIKNQ
jgi:hypothetical protein